MHVSFLKRLSEKLKYCPLHPQWHIFRHEKKQFKIISKQLDGNILDIGCGHQNITKFINPESEYTGLDYYTTSTEWYGSTPDIYGDALQLPVHTNTFDSILLLDVLEHLEDPDLCIQEIHRVLRPKGKLIIQVPFVYPLHDAPRDFQRWTIYGLQKLAKKHAFKVTDTTTLGTISETCALIVNIGASKMILEWLDRRHPLSVLIFFLPIQIILTNITAWILSPFCTRSYFMPNGQRMTWTKIF